MARSGGAAAQLGFLYQNLWTVDAALDVIDGDFTELIAEPHRDHGVGIDFILTRSSGDQLFHSVKLRQPDGNWTISRLSQEDRPGRSTLGDLVAVTRAGGIGVFCSGTSASDLKAVVKQARASTDWKDFEQRIRGNQRIYAALLRHVIPMCGSEDEALSALKCLCVRSKDEDELKKDIDRRIRTMFRRESQESLDPQPVRLLIADLAARNLGQSLTSASIHEFLESHGYLPSRLAGDRTVEGRIRNLSQTYMADVRSLLINGSEIVRHEADFASRNLLKHGKHVMLEGTAGTGKSCVLAQVLRQLDDREVPCLVVRLDQLQDGSLSAQSLGGSLGLPESPSITLGEFAGGQPCVLCFDQLDALSVVSARRQQIWGPFRDMLVEAERYPNLRLLFACRTFDLEQDPRLRSLLVQHDQVERIPIGPLDTATVRAVLDVAGDASELLSEEQIRVLAIPLNLYLFLEAGRTRPLDFAAVGDLFDAFWSHKAREVSRHVGHPTVWAGAVATLCNALSEHEALMVPQYVMDEHVEALEAMASEDVVRVSSLGVRFFHESFFDYAFARTFLRSNSDLVSWLASDSQHLFRRSQVRQILEFLRSRDSNQSRYLRVLEDLLDNQRVRFHIKKLVLDWLSQLPNPTSEEWRLLEDLDSEFESHIWSTVSNSVPWFDLLHEMGRWALWLDCGDVQVNRTIRLLESPNILDARSANVAELIAPFRNWSDSWRSRLRRLAMHGHGYGSPEMQSLVLCLIADGTLDDDGPGLASNDDWWLSLHSVAAEQPAFVTRVLGTWFDRQLVIGAEGGRDDPFREEKVVAPFSQFTSDAIWDCATHAPREFVREMLPRFASFDRQFPREWFDPPSRFGSPVDQLRDALADAMARLASSDPAELDSVMSETHLPDSTWMSALVMQAWSTNPEFYAERISQFLLDRPDQRLCIGYGMWNSETDAFVAVSRTAVAAASAHCSHESLVELLNAIEHFEPDDERNTKYSGQTELALLLALAEERVPNRARLRIQELEQRFDFEFKRGVPEPPSDPFAVSEVDSPIPWEVLCNMTDDELLSAMTQYAAGWESEPTGAGHGSAIELSQAIRTLVLRDPKRFAHLVEHMDASLHPAYFESILRGLTQGKGDGRPGTVLQVCVVLRRIERIGSPVSTTEIAHAIRTLADEEIPEDILSQIRRIAEQDTSPETDEWQLRDPRTKPLEQAMNSSRGAAAIAISKLLFSDRGRWAAMRLTVSQLASDPVLAVRVATVPCLLAVLDEYRQDALAYFGELVDGADAILGSDPVVQFVHYAMFRDYDQIRAVLHRMLRSPDSEVAVAGARQMAIAALSIDVASEDLDQLVMIGDEARIGVAEVCAANITSEALGRECERRLRTFFADDSPTVRKAASECWRYLEPDQIASRGPLIAHLAQTMEPDDNVSILAHKLGEAQCSLPAAVCDLAERSIDLFGSRASSWQLREGGIANNLSKLMVRLYEQTTDDTLRTRTLNTIDDMVRTGFLGIDDRLSERFHR